MTAVTVTAKKEVTGMLAMEVVKCTATDAYTYTSKFGTIVACFVNDRSRTGAWLSVSGNVVTVNCSSASGDVVDLLIFGY